MSLFDKIFGNRPKERGTYQGAFRMLNGYTPKFTTYGGSIYESELIRAAINARAVHISKLRVETRGAAKPALQNKLAHGPSEWATWSQLLYRISTILDIHNTAFLCPVYDKYGEVSGIFAPLPDRCEVVQFSNTPYLRYRFSNGETAAIELENCGIMNKFQYRDDMFGESNHALLSTLDLIHIQEQGIKEGVKSAATYRFWAQLSNFTKDEDLVKERKRFTRENFMSDGGGMLLFPNKYTNINQVKSDPWVVDADEMKIIKDNVFEYFMINEDILESKAYGDSWSAFYESCVETFAIQFSEVMTRMLFTYREQSNGNEVVATANRIQYMSNQDKLAVSADMLDRGIMSINDVREIWNLPPVDGGDGRIIRGEYYNADEKVGETNE